MGVSYVDKLLDLLQKSQTLCFISLLTTIRKIAIGMENPVNWKRYKIF